MYFNHKTYANLSAIFSNYYYRYKNYSDGLHYLWKSNVQSYQLKYDMEHTASRNLKIKAGGALHFFLLQDRAVLITMVASLMWSLFGWTGGKCWI